MVQLAVRLRVNAGLSAGWGTPVEEETLGIDEVENAVSGYVRDRPLPPVIDHQIVVVMWGNLRREHDDLIKRCKKKLFQTGHKCWCGMFLAFFVG